jgi:hypothetical protein
MANFAIINGDVVSNVIVADSKADSELMFPNSTVIEITNDMDPKPGIGWAWDGSLFTNFTPQTVEE